MNVKKLLCYNIVNGYNCKYENNCMFAHNIEEQTKEPIRQFIYSMITEFEDLSSINIYENEELLDNLKTYTKECRNCILFKCPGGYNCKYGACIKKIKICYNDLIYGRCTQSLIGDHCLNGVHLTLKNLIPYIMRELNKKLSITSFNLNTQLKNFNTELQELKIK